MPQNRYDDTHMPKVLLIGNPNVGKSTIFNDLTASRQHTGNWTGKTVSFAQGIWHGASKDYQIIDLPGTYSLTPHSAEEAVTRDFLMQDSFDLILLICDATCLKRNLNLALQVLSRTSQVLLCVNMMDEAKKQHLSVDLDRLSHILGIPVVGTSARDKLSLQNLCIAIETTINSPRQTAYCVSYDDPIESALDQIVRLLHTDAPAYANRFSAVQLLQQTDFDDYDAPILEYLVQSPKLQQQLDKIRTDLSQYYPDHAVLQHTLHHASLRCAENICQHCISCTNPQKQQIYRIDRILTGKYSAWITMSALLILLFWLTIIGANYPSNWLANGFTILQHHLSNALIAIHTPLWLHDLLVLGLFQTTFCVISVMLPPMAIFFSLFGLLEDIGYLPRIAYNLDKPFQKCHACGKQALCMCMSLGCNAVGVSGCRIIDSPRERRLALLTASFIPCNGRLPLLILLITLFFHTAHFPSLVSALLLSVAILFCIAVTFLVTTILSRTLLRGMPSFFVLELPPYRKPMWRQVILRSFFDRSIFVLGRAVCVAAPSGVIIWLFANLSIHDTSILTIFCQWLDPFGKIMGLDGVILTAFLFALPANEIFLPIVLMCYLSQGSLCSLENIWQIHQIFLLHGWTALTAVCVCLFSLFHWPCSTTMITLYKETHSVKWTALACLLPTGIGIFLCILCNSLAKLC